MSEDMTERTNMRVTALEQLVEELKEANEALIAEMNEMGGDAEEVVSGPGRGSITALKEALHNEREAHKNSSEALKASKQELQQLAAQIEKLEDDLFRLRGDVGTGRHIPPGVRVLELADNPAARWFGKREEDVQRLKKENEALRAMIGDGVSATSSAASGGGLAPKETMDALEQEKLELEQTIKEKEKRLLRLQQVR
jgi:mitotic spindle assembly checkpoint protein MAD1